MAVRVKIARADYRRFVNDRNGPVIRAVAVAAQQVKEGARRQVGVSEGRQFTSRGQSQHLRDAIVLRIGTDRGGTVVRVGSDLPHALVHHEGSRPHQIRPVRAKALRFTVARVVVFARVVNHPGTRANRYLVDAARRAGLRTTTRRR